MRKGWLGLRIPEIGSLGQARAMLAAWDQNNNKLTRSGVAVTVDILPGVNRHTVVVPIRIPDIEGAPIPARFPRLRDAVSVNSQ